MTETAFVGGTLIDGTGTAPLADSAVLARDGRVAWTGPVSELERTPELHVVDVTGKYVIPGLLDANVHLVFDIEPNVLLQYEPGRYDELAIEAAQVAVRAGITTVFDTWGPLESLRRVRDRIDEGEVVGSRIFLAGNIIGNGGPWSDDFMASFGAALSAEVVESVNRHWEQNVGPELTWMSADDVRAEVREYIATSGIDFLKYASSAHKHARFLAFSPDAQRAIVEEAHAAGLTAQACAQAPEPLKVSIEAGVDLLQHGDLTGTRPMPADTFELVVSRQLPCVAQILTERHIAAFDGAPALHAGGWGQMLLVKDDNDRRLIGAGAKLLLSTDGGLLGPTASTSPALGGFLSVPDVLWHLGSSHLLWLQAAVDRGMDPMEALLSTTRNIAQGYAKDDELGTLEPGKRADLVVLDGDPLDDVANYARIAHVVKDGEIVDRERLPEHPVLTAGDEHPSLHPPALRA